jgi:cell division septation protein DedD
MQDMMKNLMGDMLKSVGDMNAMNLMQDMNPTKIWLQMLDFQKSAFNNTYDAMLQIQQQTEKMTEILLKNNPVMPEELTNMLQKSQGEIKKAVDEGFAKAESYFSAASCPAKKAKPAAAEATKEKAKPAAAETTKGKAEPAAAETTKGKAEPRAK